MRKYLISWYYEQQLGNYLYMTKKGGIKEWDIFKMREEIRREFNLRNDLIVILSIKRLDNPKEGGKKDEQ